MPSCSRRHACLPLQDEAAHCDLPQHPQLRGLLPFLLDEEAFTRSAHKGSDMRQGWDFPQTSFLPAGSPQQRHTMAACRAAQCQPLPAMCRHACSRLDSIVLVCGFFCVPEVMHFFSLFFSFVFRISCCFYCTHSFKMALRWHSGSARCFVQTTSGRFFLHSCINETTLPHLFPIVWNTKPRHFVKKKVAQN
jgi:hypothetical protein